MGIGTGIGSIKTPAYHAIVSDDTGIPIRLTRCPAGLGAYWCCTIERHRRHFYHYDPCVTLQEAYGVAINGAS